MSAVLSKFFSFDDIAKNRKEYLLLSVLVAFSVIIYFVQNYFKYHEAIGYSILRSFFFNLITIGAFIIFIPSIMRLNYFITSKTDKVKTVLFQGIGLFVVLLIYSIFISMVLYLLGFTSKPVNSMFLSKYFLNMALLHGLFCFLVVHFFSYQKNKKISEFLLVSYLNRKVHCKLSDIVWFEAMDHYVKVHTNERVYLKKTSMSALMKNLDSNQFIRIHRSYIVNRRFVKTIEKESEASFIILENGVSLKAGKTYTKGESLLLLL